MRKDHATDDEEIRVMPFSEGYAPRFLDATDLYRIFNYWIKYFFEA